jgi:hypothetical protein
LPDPTVKTMEDIFDPVCPSQPTTDHDGVTTIGISMRGGLTVDLDHPPVAARNHVHVLAHRSPFQV